MWDELDIVKQSCEASCHNENLIDIDSREIALSEILNTIIYCLKKI